MNAGVSPSGSGGSSPAGPVSSTSSRGSSPSAPGNEMPGAASQGSTRGNGNPFASARRNARLVVRRAVDATATGRDRVDLHRDDVAPGEVVAQRLPRPVVGLRVAEFGQEHRPVRHGEVDV